jgi:hypothetical protein
VKSWMTRMYKIGKIKDPILIDERPIRRKFCIINYIKDLIARKIIFLEPIWVIIRRNWYLGAEIGLWKA